MEDLQSLSLLLSKGASINHDPSSAPRWSTYHEPKARAIINVATEEDVAQSVKYLTQHSIPFFAQAGGHGWSSSIKLPPSGVIVSLRALNKAVVHADGHLITVGGGTLASKAITAAWDNDTQVMTGNCDSTGLLGSALGGGYGNLLGEHGFAVDQFVSMNVVLADGTLRTVTADDKDLWWALRGTAPNFGIVTSAVLRAYPTPRSRSQAFTGAIFFDESKLKQLVAAINELHLTPKMNIYLYFITTEGNPSIMCTPFYLGPADEAKKAFASIYDVGPTMEQTGITPYNKWNAGAAALNIKGGRKPAYGANLGQLDAETWADIWQDYKELVASNPDFETSLIICEAYSRQVAQSLEPRGPATASSFPGRNLRFTVAAVVWHNNADLDRKADEFGRRAREAWRKSSGLESPATYVNFAYGDEPNEVVYGSATARLRELKKRFDPGNVFGCWFSLKD